VAHDQDATIDHGLFRHVSSGTGSISNRMRPYDHVGMVAAEVIRIFTKSG
jgi:hypothetical protein